jgi:hypothetical protein
MPLVRDMVMDEGVDVAVETRANRSCPLKCFDHRYEVYA